ncbi:MAG: circularly permuted type 2 ATP-grasp protein [Phycisphaeraceae bacterium]
MFDGSDRVRPEAKALVDLIEQLPAGELQAHKAAIERAMLRLGVTFTVYGDEHGTEKIFPFDIIPRMINAAEWAGVEKGLRQRIKALNMLVDDIYHDQQIFKDGVIPRDVLEMAESYRPQCKGIDPPNGIWCHIVGTDLIRGKDGQVYVLEDNLRCPSGVSYVLQNRMLMKRSFPELFAGSRIQPVVDYAGRLYDTLAHLASEAVANPTVVVLSPGVFNSAYYEHSYLAQQMGVQLVEGRDLVVQDGFVYMRTTEGLEKVDVIYRRIDDDFLDPKAFREDSMLGVPGIMDVYRSGNVALANAPGGGVADDKVMYAFVPDAIRYYLNEEPILASVPTYLCMREDDRNFVLDNLGELVVKAANESGGYGMLMGPSSTAEQREKFASLIEAKPRNYIAQPVVSLSRVPTMIEEPGQSPRFEGRHVDLRPYILYGKDIWVMPGGLTRVALKKGSLVVNSSQGGGSKDTWVVEASEGGVHA